MTAMKTRITNAKIACLDINLQKARMQLGVQIVVDNPEELEAIRRRFVDTVKLVNPIANQLFLIVNPK